ncbi:hypothetical protein UFOVP49_44 [uncultured Caudovirales phage]|uniref:Uncharacterized protein n=1 Tax=uncultured Caudovirales phage TaxID=2100421 RepID=A0A6J5KSP0_9CAUD|nr:hypothetical protein UFOVP49_44 [uncultured Caudovirales phage]
MSKFGIFTSVNMISLRESKNRRAEMSEQMVRYGVPRHEYYLTDRWTDISKYSGITAKYPEHSSRVQGTLISHLEMMRHWYLSTSEPYAIFCDDDIDFSVSEYWNFTLDEFVQNLPADWECVQLVRGQMAPGTVGRDSYDCVLKIMYGRWWGVCSLMSRSYVKKCLDRHLRGYSEYDLRLLDWYPEVFDPNLIEYVENILYLCKGVVYNYPLLLTLDPFNVESTYSDVPTEDDVAVKMPSRICREAFLDLWKSDGIMLDLKTSLTV